MIKIRTHITLPVQEVWRLWTEPEHVMNWNAASADWHCPAARSQVKEGGDFCYTMAAKDGSAEFDLKGTFTLVQSPNYLETVLEDGRKTSIHFHPVMNGVEVTQRFEPESENSEDLQRQGWQAILDNFKRYAELTLK